MTSETLTLIAAWFGALAGLAIVPQLSGKSIPSAVIAALLVLYLSRCKHPRPHPLTLSGVLGIACTALTVSLVS